MAPHGRFAMNGESGRDLRHLRRRADVHRHDQLALVRRGHHRIPVPVLVVDRGQTEGRGVLRERERGRALRRAALDLRDRELRVPHRDEHQRDVPAGSRAAPLVDHPVVVGLQADEAELPVARLHEQLAAEPGEGREAQRREDPGLVHVLEARLRVVAARAHLAVGERLGAELLLRLARHRAEARARDTAGRRTPSSRGRSRRPPCAAPGRDPSPRTRSTQRCGGSRMWSSTEISQSRLRASSLIGAALRSPCA